MSARPQPVTSEQMRPGWVRTLDAIAPMVMRLGEDDEHEQRVEAAIRSGTARGYFNTEEAVVIRGRFATYLTARAALHELIAEIAPLAQPDADRDEEDTLRAFIIGYAAGCLLVRAARYLVDTWGGNGVLIRKLDEGSTDYRIPPKQYTAIYRALTDPRTGWRLLEAREFAEQNQAAIDGLRDDPEVGGVVRLLHDIGYAVQVPVRRFLLARWRFRRHSARRRGRSAMQQGVFLLAEAFGRVIADIQLPWRGARHRVRVVHDELVALLQPGDVFITRHDDALSNLFLPGFWPHAALHLGTRPLGDELGVEIDADRGQRWQEPRRVLEARKDGVLLRELSDTLAVDAVALIRPQLDPDQIRTGLSRALAHEGKLYNFDFDFFRDDRLVCTEVVYRAYDGLGSMAFELTSRAGRLTFSAQDLVGLAIDQRGFDVVAVYGGPACDGCLVTGAPARDALARTIEGDA